MAPNKAMSSSVAALTVAERRFGLLTAAVLVLVLGHPSFPLKRCRPAAPVSEASDDRPEGDQQDQGDQGHHHRHHSPGQGSARARRQCWGQDEQAHPPLGEGDEQRERDDETTMPLTRLPRPA